MGAALSWTKVSTPAGPFVLVGPPGVVMQAFWAAEPPPGVDAVRDDGALTAAVAEVNAWFNGDLTGFTVPLAPAGTAFQQRVWGALREIPFGETTTYGALAHHLRSTGGARAVGAASGANPIPLLIPCHRVVGAKGELVGYVGGTDVKNWLLHRERLLSGKGQTALPFGLHRRG